jgi:hypothetical protein
MARSTVNVDVQVQTKSINDLEQELSQINEQLKGVAIGSKSFDDLSLKAQGLTRELNKANTAAEGFTDDKKFMAADGAIKTMAGSVSGVVGALGLLGVESEAFGEMEKKAASAIAVAIGIKDVSEGFNQLRKSQVLATTATKAYNLAVTAGNKIMKLFNITMKANPIGILITALGIVGGLIYGFRDQILNLMKKALGPFKGIIDKIAGAFTALGEKLGIVDDAQTKQTKANIKRMERELAIAEAKGETTLQMEKDLLLERRKLLEKGSEEYEQSITDELVLDAKATKEKEDNAQALADKKKAIADQEAKDKQAQADKDKADADKKTTEDIAKEKARVAGIENILDSFVTRQEDKDADTRQKKIDLEEQRKLEDLERLGATDTEINEAKDFYAGLRKEAEVLDKEEADAKKAADEQAELDALEQQEQKKLDLKMNSLQTLSELFGQETALGKVALLAKQAILVQEMIAEAKGLTFKAKNAATEAGIDGVKAVSATAAGTAETAKVGFPQNIPLLIGYAAQAAGIISTVKSAVSKTKQIAGQAGASSGGVDISSPNIPTGGIGNQLGPAAAQPSLPPQPNMVNQSVRAYVVSGDVNSAQEADARLSRRRSLG